MEAFEATGGIGKWHAGYELHINTRSSTEHESGKGPVHDSNASNISGSENEMVAFFHFTSKIGDLFGVVRKVAVHFHDIFVVSF